jgi:hypothetical protein
MTQKHFEGIVVNGAQLAQAIAYGKGDKCLDFNAGGIVPATDCPATDIGEGRPALKRGKRFIRIPTLDELCEELKARYDDWESGDYEDDDELLPNNPDAEAVRELLKPVIEAVRQDPGYQEYCEHLHQDLAAEETALHWIASLRPSVMVGWFEDGLGVTRVYDPAEKNWVDAV